MDDETNIALNKVTNISYRASRVIGRVNRIHTNIKGYVKTMDEACRMDDPDVIKKITEQYIDIINRDLEKVDYETLKEFMKTGKGF